MSNISKLLTIGALSLCTLSTFAEVKPLKTMCETSKNIPNATKINVDCRFCKIIVNQSDSENTISGKLEAMVEEEGYAINIAEAGNEYTVTVTVPEGSASFAGEITLSVKPDVALNITSTSGYLDISGMSNCNITATTTQGKVTVKDCNGNMNIETKNGSYTIENVKGNMSFASSTGSITAENVDGNMSFDTPDGAFALTNAKGNLKCSTIAGTQTYSNIDGTLTIKGSSGSIKISTFTGTLNINTTSSPVNLYDVKADMHIKTTKGAVLGSKYITLTGSSDFETTEGKVNLRLQNTKEELTFALTSENSKASLIAKGTSKNKKLNTGKGSIVVTGHSKTGAQIFY
ncbi:MAG: DUF4097 family beta strand repeat protein [Bacteroidales bacterium]|nr:DUF4097 family beta strand repeat protein [Bacteroidales bacterium]